jgi:hypothetical protein
MEGIERDRGIIKAMKRFRNENINAAYAESLRNKRISYVPNLIRLSSNTASSRREGTSYKTLKIKNMSTRNILYALSESFKNINTRTIKKLEQIKEELRTRGDLFTAILEHIESVEALEDDLYSWYPGLKTSDIFSFFLELVPDLLELYKSYYIESVILLRPPKVRLLDIFKDRLGKNMQCFDVIEKDQAIFKNLASKLPRQGLILTSSYWTEEEACDEVAKLMPEVQERVRLNKDVSAEISHSLSYAEVIVNGRELVVPFTRLNDLMTKNDRSLEFWMKTGVVNEKWEELP